MTSSLASVPLTREDIIKGLDGAAKTSLYDLVVAAGQWTHYKHRIIKDNLVDSVFTTQIGQISFRYDTSYFQGDTGLPQNNRLMIRIPDRTCRGEYEYEIWGVDDVRFMGRKIFDDFEVPDFGYPHPFQLTPHRCWDWNKFYLPKSREEGGSGRLLEREETGEVWRALMLLSVSLTRDFGAMNVPTSRKVASELLAKMAAHPNTNWGD